MNSVNSPELDIRKEAILKDVFSSIQRYELSDQETQQGMQLTPIQKMIILNLRAASIEQKLGGVIDPNEINKYIQEDAYLRGCIDTYTTMLFNDFQFQQAAAELAASGTDSNEAVIVPLP